MNSSLTPRLATSKKWTDLPQEFVDKIQLVFLQQFAHEASVGDFLIEGRIYPQEVVMRIGYLEKGRLKQINFEASMNLPSSGGSESTPNILSEDEADLSQDLDNDFSDGLGDDPNETWGDDTEFDADSIDADEFEAGKGSGSKTMDCLYTCIDALGSLMEEYFELDAEEEIEVPMRWKEYDFEGETVFLQHSTVNSRLEEEADRLLAMAAGDADKQLVHEESNTEDALGNAEIDSELAFEIQKAIRSGNYKLTDESELN